MNRFLDLDPDYEGLLSKDGPHVLGRTLSRLPVTVPPYCIVRVAEPVGRTTKGIRGHKIKDHSGLDSVQDGGLRKEKEVTRCFYRCLRLSPRRVHV